MTKAYLGLGSNMGDREAFLRFARQQIQAKMGKISAVSAVFQTAPWGFASANYFLNQVLELQTPLSAEDLLLCCQAVEKAAGRTAKTADEYHDRVLDIDILYYGNLVFHTDRLQIPHPHIATRRFVLEPLCQIAPHFADPLTGKTAEEMLQDFDNNTVAAM